MEKKVVSQFEYAIGEIAEGKDYTKTHRPRTDEEELDLRQKNLQSQFDKLQIKTS